MVALPPIEQTSWPLVVVRWTGTLEEGTLDAFLGQMDQWLAREERFGLLVDSRGARGLPPDQRQRLIRHMQQRAPQTSRLLVQAIVLDSLLQRTLFYGINLLFPNPFPSRVFAEVAPAQAWLEDQLGLGSREVG